MVVSDIMVGGMALVALLGIVAVVRGSARQRGERHKGDGASVGVMASDSGACGDNGGDCGGGDGGGGGD